MGDISEATLAMLDEEAREKLLVAATESGDQGLITFLGALRSGEVGVQPRIAKRMRRSRASSPAVGPEVENLKEKLRGLYWEYHSAVPYSEAERGLERHIDVVEASLGEEISSKIELASIKEYEQSLLSPVAPVGSARREYVAEQPPAPRYSHEAPPGEGY